MNHLLNYDMKISEASVEDVPALCALVNKAYRGDLSRKGWTTEADLLEGMRIDEPTLQQYIELDNSIILKATNDAYKLTGCVYLEYKSDQLYLGMLTVDPALQGKGIGKMLLKASEEISAIKGYKTIHMTVISARIELINWYERHGFHKTGHKEPFPDDEKFGKPKMPLEFLVLEKSVNRYQVSGIMDKIFQRLG